MSSETSTKEARPKADAAPDPGLQPWQFFVLAALGCATAVTFIARGQGPAVVILLGILMSTAALVGYAALRMLRPLMSAQDDRTVMIGQRTRVALEREKMLALRSIKELEFDRAMGRLSDEDWKEMSSRLRVRAARLIRQLDAGVGYRSQIERELQKRLESAALKGPRPEDKGLRGEDRADPDGGRVKAPVETSAARVCGECGTANDMDARYCKGCGQILAGR